MSDWKYYLLTQDEIDDRLASNVLAREREHWEYHNNLCVFKTCCEKLSSDSKMREQMECRCCDEEARMNEVAHLRDSLLEQFADQERREAAFARVSKKDKAERQAN